jgi:hypothetical protein
MKRLEIAAAAVSAAILITAAVYWVLQVRDVLAQFEKAYGGG